MAPLEWFFFPQLGSVGEKKNEKLSGLLLHVVDLVNEELHSHDPLAVASEGLYQKLGCDP